MGQGISARDVEVLEFVARFGVVPRDAVASWAGSGKTATWVREKRLREADLIRVETPVGRGNPYLSATALGLEVCGRHELLPARVSTATFRHFGVVSRFAAGLEGAGERLLSERELLAQERAMGDRQFSIPMGEDQHHRPDLILLEALPSPVEVELSHKNRKRLDRILAGWKEAVDGGRFARVLYRCSEKSLPYVKRSVTRIAASEQIDVELLPSGCELAADGWF